MEHECDHLSDVLYVFFLFNHSVMLGKTIAVSYECTCGNSF